MHLLPWHYFAFSTVLFSSIASLVIRKLMTQEKHDAVLSMIVFQFTLTAITLGFALIKGFIFPFPTELLPRMFISATLYAVGSLCNFYASKYLEAGELTILNAGGAIITIILGVVFIGNTFTLLHAVGTLSIMLAIWILYAKIHMKMNKGVWYALGLAVSYAVAVVNDVIIIRTYDPISFIPVMSFLPGLIIAVLFYKRLPGLSVFLKGKTLIHIFMYSIFYALSAITFYLALDSGASISQLSPISRASIISTVVLSALLLNERNDLKRKILSAVLVSIGVLLLA